VPVPKARRGIAPEVLADGDRRVSPAGTADSGRTEVSARTEAREILCRPAGAEGLGKVAARPSISPAGTGETRHETPGHIEVVGSTSVP